MEGFLLLHYFRRAIVLLFLLSLAVFMLSSISMITLFMVPFDIQAEQTWQRPQPENPMDSVNYFVKDFFFRQLLELDSKLSDTDAAFGEYMSDVETLSSFIQSQNGNISSKKAFRIASALKHYSLKYGVPFDLAIAVANTESHFDPNAKSSYGAIGLMQVVWRVHSALLRANGIYNEEMLLLPEFGAAAGCLLLSRYLKDSDSVETALGRYYGGDSSIYWSRISKALNYYRKHNDKR